MSWPSHGYMLLEDIVETKDDTFDQIGGDPDGELQYLDKVKVTSEVLGQGSYGTVFKAKYKGVPCAAKQLDRLCVASGNSSAKGAVSQELAEMNFMLECLQHNKLRHPNIVKMMGVFCGKTTFLVMELMEYNLTQLLENTHNIIMYVKLSILQDVSRGLEYLHAHNPPIVHQALYSDNILFTKGLLAKIADFKTGAETVSERSLQSVRWNTKTNDFLPDSHDVLIYDIPLNVFSFGCIACHVITQIWPLSHSEQRYLSTTPAQKSLFRSYQSDEDDCIDMDYTDRKVACTVNDWSVEKHQVYINMIDEDDDLKHLVEACLQCNIKYRPHMSQIYNRITSLMSNHSKDDDIKDTYYQVMKQELDQSIKNFQLLVVGAPNTGKTSLISSFLGEEFVEEQPATIGADEGTCKLHSRDWIRIKDSAKDDILHNQLTDQSRNNVLEKLILSSSLTSTLQPPSRRRKSSITDDTGLLFSATNIKSMRLAGASSSSFKTNSDSLIASLWDFAGQVIFHNTHSVFISESGVSVITFNASMNLTDYVVGDDKEILHPTECRTIISSIHYWLQVVNSVCSVKENVLLVGTHIDKLHPDLKKARKIASNKILPILEKELIGKPYADHIAHCTGEGLEGALKKSCFFVSNKDRDGEIEKLKDAAVGVATLLRAKEKPLLMYLKIERVLLKLKKQVISVSTMLKLVAENTFPLKENSPEFKRILKYFHNNRTIMHFSQIKSLKDYVILSPLWLAKLFSYVIAAQSYKTGGNFDWAWKRLTRYGILHDCLLQHMLDKFYSDYPVDDKVRVTKEQTVDILLYFHLLARITSSTWFAEEDSPPLPETGDTFIVPSLVRIDDRNPPETEQERIIYFMFNSGFIPVSLLNRLIAKCICRSVERDDRLLWMRRGKIGSKLGTDQKYYISKCEEKQSIQLTITIKGDDMEHIRERMNLIDDVTYFLDDIMGGFMPATKERPSLQIPCKFCPKLHIPLDDACSDKTINCPNAGDEELPSGYYRDLQQASLANDTNTAAIGQRNRRKLDLFRTYYSSLAILNFKELCPHLVTAEVITYQNSQYVQQADQATGASYILDKVLRSLDANVDVVLERFLSTLENHGSNHVTAASPPPNTTGSNHVMAASPPPNTTDNHQKPSSQEGCCSCCNLM